MKQIKPLKDKVLGFMIEPLSGTRQTLGGVYLTADETSEDHVRPRWFQITHIGPEQEELYVNQYVLVPFGRWSRGINIENDMREDQKLFLIDHDDVLGVSDEIPS